MFLLSSIVRMLSLAKGDHSQALSKTHFQRGYPSSQALSKTHSQRETTPFISSTLKNALPKGISFISSTLKTHSQRETTPSISSTLKNSLAKGISFLFKHSQNSLAKGDHSLHFKHSSLGCCSLEVSRVLWIHTQPSLTEAGQLTDTHVTVTPSLCALVLPFVPACIHACA